MQNFHYLLGFKMSGYFRVCKDYTEINSFIFTKAPVSWKKN